MVALLCRVGEEGGHSFAMTTNVPRARTSAASGSIASIPQLVLAASGIRSILAVRKRALRRERVIEGETMGSSAKSSPNAWRVESRVCLARMRNNLTSKARTVPEILAKRVDSQKDADLNRHQQLDPVSVPIAANIERYVG